MELDVLGKEISLPDWRKQQEKDTKETITCSNCITLLIPTHRLQPCTSHNLAQAFSAFSSPQHCQLSEFVIYIFTCMHHYDCGILVMYPNYVYKCYNVQNCHSTAFIFWLLNLIDYVKFTNKPMISMNLLKHLNILNLVCVFSFVWPVNFIHVYYDCCCCYWFESFQFATQTQHNLTKFKTVAILKME